MILFSIYVYLFTGGGISSSILSVTYHSTQLYLFRVYGFQSILKYYKMKIYQIHNKYKYTGGEETVVEKLNY